MVLIVVEVCWVAVILIFLARGRPSRETRERKRDRSAWVGFALQFIAVFAAFEFRRAPFTPVTALDRAFQFTLGAVAIALAVGAVLLQAAAVRALGKQLALAARLVEGHELVTAGPYRWVRHPIYTCLLCLFLATGLTITNWMVLAPALALFLMGTVIRLRSEERLLREAFGEEFDEYARRVPALVPRLRSRR